MASTTVTPPASRKMKTMLTITKRIKEFLPPRRISP
jgi:hypothetical protein